MFQFFLIWFIVIDKDIIHTSQDDEEICFDQFSQALRSEILINNSFNTSQMTIIFFDNWNTAAASCYHNLTSVQESTDSFNFFDVNRFW